MGSIYVASRSKVRFLTQPLQHAATRIYLYVVEKRCDQVHVGHLGKPVVHLNIDVGIYHCLMSVCIASVMAIGTYDSPHSKGC